MIATKKPIILSSGLATWTELDSITTLIQASASDFSVLQCTTSYPCEPELWGLNNIHEIATRYDCLPGYSDHSGTISAGLAAVALGAKIIEVHVTFSHECFGPDVASSITLDQLSELVRGVRSISQALLNPVNKNYLPSELEELKRKFGKSIFIVSDLMPGHTLAPTDFTYKKPGIGVPEAMAPSFIGRRIRVALKKGHMLREEDII
jgi:N-acetylneuraminate synthase